MVSSKDIQEAKKIFQHFRQFSKKFFDDFYAKEAKVGRYPWPHEAMAALGRILKRATETEEEWPPQPLDRPGVSPEVFEAFLSSTYFQEVYRVACDAHVRHMPGFKKGKPGRKAEIELAKRIWALADAGNTSREIKAELKRDGINLAVEGVEYYRKTKRRLRKQ
jgi:hypothetical protein